MPATSPCMSVTPPPSMHEQYMHSLVTCISLVWSSRKNFLFFSFFMFWWCIASHHHWHRGVQSSSRKRQWMGFHWVKSSTGSTFPIWQRYTGVHTTQCLLLNNFATPEIANVCPPPEVLLYNKTLKAGNCSLEFRGDDWWTPKPLELIECRTRMTQ